jgi:hypothetical protein
MFRREFDKKDGSCSFWIKAGIERGQHRLMGHLEWVVMIDELEL